MSLEELHTISDVSLPLFAFYLIIFCNFTKELLGCKLMHVLDTNIYAKHLIGFVLLFFLVIMVDSKNMEKNLLSNFGYSLMIYVLFIITTRLPYYIMLLFMIILLIMYILGVIAKKKLEEQKEEEYKQLKLAQSILFIILCCIGIIGFIVYFIEKYKEYSSNFSFIKFILGDTVCRNYTPKNAKII
jgi:Ca2+/Na+ antiporter